MRTSESQPPSKTPSRIRRWTTERQIGFLQALEQTGSVTKASASVGMSREGAYRLRARDPRGLFSALWDRTCANAGRPIRKGHACAIGDNSLTRLLGPLYRRKRGDYAAIGTIGGRDRKHDRTGPS